MSALEGLVAVVTCASSGLGRAYAKVLAARGAMVIVHDEASESQAVDATVEAIRKSGGTAFPLVCDVTDLKRLQTLLRDAERERGHVDILVNNSVSDAMTPAQHITHEEFNQAISLVVKPAFFATQALVRGMKARRSGKIINVSSIGAMVGRPVGSHYCAARAALLGFTREWARELAPWNINVNSVAPGNAVTEIVRGAKARRMLAESATGVPLGRNAEVEELAYTVAFLASPEANFITGQTISPNGGEVIVGI